MCLSTPKIPDPPKPPPPPSAPTPMAKTVVNPALKKREKQRRRGVSALTIRRGKPTTVNLSGMNTGANIY